jgi:hypothetical protein
MKILIAGDSYAQCNMNYSVNSWCYTLKSICNYDITNIAFGGTSLAWTYKRILEAKNSNDWHTYDKVIVVITNHGRGYTRRILTLPKIEDEDRISSYNILLGKLQNKNKNNDPYYDEFIAAKGWFEHIYDNEIEIITHKGLIEEIKKIIPEDKLILINGCADPIIFKDHFKYDICLKKITENEILKVLPKGLDYLIYRESRIMVNHMTPSNNLRVAIYIKNILDGMNPTFDLSNFDKISPYDFHLYYTQIS